MGRTRELDDSSCADSPRGFCTPYAQDKIVKLGDDLADQLQVMKQLMTTQENREALEKELKKQHEANDMIRVSQY